MVAVASSVAVLSPYLQLCAGVGGFPSSLPLSRLAVLLAAALIVELVPQPVGEKDVLVRFPIAAFELVAGNVRFLVELD